MFRVANVGKTQLSLGDGIWPGRDTESDMHFVADSSGVVKTRSIRQNIPSRQSSLELLQRITATPWDPTGSKRDADAFILPLSKDGPQPLSEGASKEDFAAEEPLDDYIEPERAHFRMTWLTCRLKGAKWHFRRRHFLRCHVFASIAKFLPRMGTFILARVLILLQHWNASMNMNRKKLDLVPRCSDFRVYSLSQL